MRKFVANENDMKQYTEIIQRLAFINMQRNQVVLELSQWEKAHAEEFPDEPQTEAEQPQ